MGERNGAAEAKRVESTEHVILWVMYGLESFWCSSVEVVVVCMGGEERSSSVEFESSGGVNFGGEERTTNRDEDDANEPCKDRPKLRILLRARKNSIVRVRPTVASGHIHCESNRF